MLMYSALRLNGVSAATTRRGSCIAGVTRVNPVKSSYDFSIPSSCSNYVRQSAPDDVHPLRSLDRRVLLIYIHDDLSTTFVCGEVFVVLCGLVYGGYAMVWSVVVCGFSVTCGIVFAVFSACIVSSYLCRLVSLSSDGAAIGSLAIASVVPTSAFALALAVCDFHAARCALCSRTVCGLCDGPAVWSAVLSMFSRGLSSITFIDFVGLGGCSSGIVGATCCCFGGFAVNFALISIFRCAAMRPSNIFNALLNFSSVCPVYSTSWSILASSRVSIVWRSGASPVPSRSGSPSFLFCSSFAVIYSVRALFFSWSFCT
jgi:hypothetical protein